MTLGTKNSDHPSLFSEDSTGLILLRHDRPWGSVSWPDIGPPFTFVEIGPKDSHVDQAAQDRLAKAVLDATNRTGGQPFQRNLNEVRTYVYGGDYIDAPLVMNAKNGAVAKNYFIHANSLYSVQAVTDAAGQMAEQYTYGAYGDRKIVGSTTNDSAIGLTVGFTGLRDDGGLLFARNRYMSTSLGRWISRDPMGYIDGKNLYQSYFVPGTVDPSGETIHADCDAVSYFSSVGFTAFYASADDGSTKYTIGTKLDDAYIHTNLDQEILAKMIAEPKDFKFKDVSALKSHVAARKTAVALAASKKFNFPGGGKINIHNDNPIFSSYDRVDASNPAMPTAPGSDYLAYFNSINNDQTDIAC